MSSPEMRTRHGPAPYYTQKKVYRKSNAKYSQKKVPRIRDRSLTFIKYAMVPLLLLIPLGVLQHFYIKFMLPLEFSPEELARESFHPLPFLDTGRDTRNSDPKDNFNWLDKKISTMTTALSFVQMGWDLVKMRNSQEWFLKEISKRKKYLDDIMNEIMMDIEEERVDYALALGGAFVVNHSEHCLVWEVTSWRWWLFNGMKNGVHKDAAEMISPSFGDPGKCFPLKGSSGFVVIKLRTAIVPEAVTLEHMWKVYPFNRLNAPKDCRIYGWLQKHDISDQIVDIGKKILLTEFKYDLEKSNAQTFNVLETPNVVDRIGLEFTSNHGNPAHTCIYCLRVHGHESKPVLTLTDLFLKYSWYAGHAIFFVCLFVLVVVHVKVCALSLL